MSGDKKKKSKKKSKKKAEESWQEAAIRLWGDARRLTPRQAVTVSMTLGMWVEQLDEWLEYHGDPRFGQEPLAKIEPLVHFDARVLARLGDEEAFARNARDRCRVVADEVDRGLRPNERDGCYFDEVVFGLALDVGESEMEAFEESEAFAGVPATAGNMNMDEEVDEDDDSDIILGDHDWGLALDIFANEAQWDDWGEPVLGGLLGASPILDQILEDRHPSTWFQTTGGQRPHIYDTVHKVRARQAQPKGDPSGN
jgi:hypothetical protein